MNLSSISALVKLISANPAEAKALIKLASLEVLHSLGSGKYTIALENQTLTAQSEKNLSVGEKYWAQVIMSKDSKPTLTHLIKTPQLFTLLKNNAFTLTLQELQTLLKSPKPATVLGQQLLEMLSNTNSKEEFSTLSTLLLSLHNQTLTLPILYRNYFSILQLKKRYNKSSKKQFIDFYAAFEFLGPISGLITLEEHDISVALSVAFAQTKHFLEQDMNNFSYTVTIDINEQIAPLYEANAHTLLDISI